MSKSRPQVVKVSTPGDVVCATAHSLGFMPRDSVVIVCLHGPRRRIGLVMRFDLDAALDADRFVEAAVKRVRHEGADRIFALVFNDTVFSDTVFSDTVMPYAALAESFATLMAREVLDVLLVRDGRWWSYLCDQPCCGGPAGTPIDGSSPGATALAAAYAFVGQGVLPDRESVVRSLGVALDAAGLRAITKRIERSIKSQVGLNRATRRRLICRLTEQLMADRADPRAVVSDGDIADFVALCDDVIVRDEVLVLADGRRRREELLAVLLDIVRHTPPPYDAPVCAMLAWVAYAGGDGVIANVAVDRCLATQPDYSLARLILDALEHQVPPEMLEEVMRGAAHDLWSRDAAG